MEKQPDTKSIPCGELYSKFIARKTLFIFTLLVVLMILVVVRIDIGPVHLGIKNSINALIARMFPFINVECPRLAYNIVGYRLPRVVLGIVVGAGLGIAGAVMQGVLRNPLVSPFTIGVSSGASFGASLAIILGFSLVGSTRYVVVINAFIFAMVASFLILGIGRLRGVTPESFILAGIAVMYFFSACTSFLNYISEEGGVTAVVFWMMGSLEQGNWNLIFIALGVTLVCTLLMMYFSWDLNAMSIGDEVAISLGVNPGRLRIISMTLVAVVTASLICITGIIGFVGLVAPHICRLIIGGDHRFLLPSSCVLGAVMVVAADIVSRIIMPPSVVPVGIILSFIGVPFFGYLLLRRKRRYWT